MLINIRFAFTDWSDHSGMRNSLLIKTVQPDQSMKDMVFQQKPFRKSEFHLLTDWSGNGPAGHFWQMKSTLRLKKRCNKSNSFQYIGRSVIFGRKGRLLIGCTFSFLLVDQRAYNSCGGLIWGGAYKQHWVYGNSITVQFSKWLNEKEMN